MVKDLVAARCRSWPMYEQYLDAARRELGLSDDDLWLAYVALGGSLSAVQLRNYFDGDYALNAREYDYLAQALNDRYIDRGEDHAVPYADVLTDGDDSMFRRWFR